MKIQNKFIDVILYGVSFFVNIFRTIGVLVGGKKEMKKGVFLKSLDFVFRIWPNYFWKKPRFSKITAFVGMFIKYVFYNDKK